MLSFLRRKKNTPEDQPQETAVEETLAETVEEVESQPSPAQETPAENFEQPYEQPVEQSVELPAETVDAEPEKKGFFARLKQGLSKTRRSFTDSLATLVLGRKEIDDDLLEELEMILLSADVGVEATDKIIRNLTDQVSRKELKDPDALIVSLKQQLQALIDPMARPLQIDEFLQSNGGPYVILMVGINGVGKTTTIGKLAKKFQLEGKSVMLAAGDTFRAAAVEQLQTWGERNNVPVIAQKTGADSAAVIFDAVQSAKARNIDVLIADTAGRLHTQSNLMEELKKVKRVIGKVDDTAPHEVMLVIDAGTGQNALNQTKQFHEAVAVSGITLTKLDGTAKGGIIFALAEQCQIPIRYIGVGESIDDLKPFDSKQFTEALFENDSE
ncbi:MULTISPECIES: signal recognition particle-docking protein FtsY [Thiomicrorhabdus]|uniref:Signal recognition particle receptor FtsY n=1 Tax=Thiomicrorhabdus heinhorstiae TaxID=2748010 RepID=A0ABS0BUR7_9GAMM|nr:MULTISPECIES: signal recognition particle-docking protein FtsY [Thiomicrorhabdus]MBF6057581.1 signal recognition particle-docking protein FtsY [Thiomicrorhabdus heinhorstiae]